MYPAIILTESIQISTYVLTISLIFSLAIIWASWRAHKKNFSQKILLNLGLGTMVGSLVGSRLMHVFYEQPSFYFEQPLRIFMLWEGGFVFYGGAMGGFFLGWVIFKISKEPWRPWADFMAPVVAFGYGFGRIGCFLGGCCYGKISHLPWATTLPTMIESRHPTQIYASILEWGIGFLLLFLEKKKQPMFPGTLFFLWLSLHSVGRIFMEFLRDDFRGPLIFGLSLSTALSLLFLTMGLGFWWTLRKDRRNIRIEEI